VAQAWLLPGSEELMSAHALRRTTEEVVMCGKGRRKQRVSLSCHYARLMAFVRLTRGGEHDFGGGVIFDRRQ